VNLDAPFHDSDFSGRRPVRGTCARSMDPRRFATMTDKAGAAAGVSTQLPRAVVPACANFSLLTRMQQWLQRCPQAGGSRGGLRFFQGRDIALRCPRPRSSGRNESRVTREARLTLRRRWPSARTAARTAQRAVPTSFSRRPGRRRHPGQGHGMGQRLARSKV
jgi:hypothetical protein